MIIYLDLVILLNFLFDLIILITTNIVLKRNTKLIRLILGSLVGELSLVFLFMETNNTILFIIKLIISIFILIVSFGYKDIKYMLNNIMNFYLVSIILGGFIYFLNIEFSYKHEGIIFYYEGMSINFIFLLIFSPLVLYIYIKQNKGNKRVKKNYLVDLVINEKIIKLNAFVDTGNKLKDPVTKKSIMLVEKHFLEPILDSRILLVPYNTLNNHSLLKCFKPKKVIIHGIGEVKCLVGISNESFNFEGVNALINEEILEEKQ